MKLTMGDRLLTSSGSDSKLSVLSVARYMLRLFRQLFVERS